MDLTDCDPILDDTTDFNALDPVSFPGINETSSFDHAFGLGGSSTSTPSNAAATAIPPPADFIYPESPDDLPLANAEDLRKALVKYVNARCESVIFDQSLGDQRHAQAMAKLSDHTWNGAPFPDLCPHDILRIHDAEEEYYDKLLARILKFVDTAAGGAAEAELRAHWDKALCANDIIPPQPLLRKAEVCELLRLRLYAKKRGVAAKRKFTVTIVKTIDVDGVPDSTAPASFPFITSWVDFLDHLRLETCNSQTAALGAWEGIGLGLQHGKWYFTSARSPTFSELSEAAYDTLKLAFWERRIAEPVVVWHELQIKKACELSAPLPPCGPGADFFNMTPEVLEAEQRKFAELCKYIDLFRERFGDWQTSSNTRTTEGDDCKRRG